MKTRKTKTHLVAIAALLLFAAVVRAQTGGSFNLTWNTTDGGGGPSAGGGFSLNGTAGQPDANAPLSGGVFSVSGGYWPGVTGGSVGPAPALAIRLGVPVNGTNTVILTWLSPSTGFVLQQTANMSGPGGGWVDVTQTPVIVGGGMNKEVSLPATGTFCMFRLRRL